MVAAVLLPSLQRPNLLLRNLSQQVVVLQERAHLVVLLVVVVLMLVMLAIAPFVAPLPFALLGLLTATIQALLFPLLVLLFVNIAVEEGKHQLAH